MSENENKGKRKNLAVRLTVEDKEDLEELSTKSGMNQNVILGYLLGECKKYNMLETDWIDNLTQISYHNLLLDADLDYKKGFEVAKYKATLATKQMLIKELVKGMPVKERIAYLKNVLGDPDNKGVDLLDNLTTQQMFSVNGQKKMYAPGQEGSPRIVGVPPTHLSQCPTGWHILNDPCLACSRSGTCEIVFDEKVEWLAANGTREEQDKFIAKSSVRRITR